MERGTTFGKRLMAMLLALIMVLSNIPGSVFAVTLPGSEAVVTLSATVERVQEAETAYTYILRVYKNDQVVMVNDTDILWTEGVQTEAFESTQTGTEFLSAEEQVTALFTYEGVQMLVAYENANENTAAFAVTHEDWANKQVQVGVPFASPVDTLADGVLAVTVTEELGENVEQAGDHYVLTAMPQNAKDYVLLTRTWKCGNDVLAQVQYAADAGVAELDNVQFMIGEEKLAENVWYDDEQTVTVKVVDGELADSKYLPSVYIDENAQSVQWTGEGTTDAPWTCEVKVSGTSHKLSIGSDYVMFNHDTTEPEITDLKAYVGSDDKVHVTVKVNAQFSGVKSLVINDKDYTDQIAENVLDVTVDAASQVKVVLDDKAGHQVVKTQEVQPKLEVDLVHSAEVASENDVHYYSAKTPLVFTMHTKGADKNDYAIVDAYLNVNGVKSDAFAYEKESGTFTYTGVDAKLSAVELQVVDAMGRTASCKLDGTFVYDTTAPVVSFSVSAQTIPAEGEEPAAKEAAMAQLENNKLYMGITDPDQSDVKFTLTASISDANPVQTDYAPSIDAQADEVSNFDLAAMFVDKAGNPAQKVSFTFGENTYYIELTDGKLDSTIYVDLQRPYSAEGDMDIAIKDKDGNAISESVVYDQNELTFHAIVTDGNGVGVKTVEYQVDGGDSKTARLENGEYFFDLGTTGEKQVTLYVVATDKLNNQNVAEYTVTIDTEVPRVEVSVPKGTNKVGNVVYFNEDQTVTVTVEDANFDAENSSVSAMINGEEVEGTLDGKVYTFHVKNGETFSNLSYLITDTVDHSVIGSRVDTVCVDTDKPVVTVTKTVAEGVKVNTVNGVDYYDGEVTYKVTVTDANLTNADEPNQPQKLALTYQLEGNSQETRPLPAVEGGWSVEGNTYTFEIKVNNGQVLNSVSVEAVDNAGNAAEQVTVEDEQGKTAFDGCTWNGNAAAVDTDDPYVIVIKSGEKTNSVGNVHYYDEHLIYEVFVTDQFMSSSPVVTVYFADGSTKNVNMSTDDDNTLLGTDSWSGLLDIEDGETVTGVSVATCDDANRKAQSAEVNDKEQITSFVVDENGVLKSEGYSLVLDKTAPTAHVAITGDLADYFYENTRTGKIYVKLNNPNMAESGKATQGTDETVTLTVTVDDENLSLTEGNYIVTNEAGDGEWKAEGNTLTYTQQITVKPDSTGVLEFSLQVKDMAGHPVELVTLDKINNTAAPEFEEDLQPEDGVFGGQVILDRQSPASSYGENGVPSITVDSDAAEVFTSNNGKDLYKGAFTYSFSVQDGTAEAGNSGLKKIVWSVEDAKNFVKAASGEFTSFDDQPFEIPVNIANPNVPGESNDCTLNITVLDNVDNKITYAKEFAVDTQAPRIQVQRTNGVCQASFAEGNNKLDLFNSDVTYQISVTDINLADCALTYQFEDGQQTVVGMEKWQKNGDVYTTELKVIDGQVLQSWSISAKDQCGNVSDKVQVAGQGDTLTKFDGCTYSGAWVAVDSSAPEITVSKSVEYGGFVQTITEGNDAIDLYDGKVTYTVKVEDEFLISGQNSIAQLVYTVEGKGTTTINLLEKNVGQPSIFSNDMDVYECEFTLDNGDVMTSMEIIVKDNANNETQAITAINDSDSKTTFDGCKYSGNLVAVNMTAPEITVTKEVEKDHKYVQTIAEDNSAIDLYDGEVTYTVNVKDRFLVSGNSAEAYLRYKVEGDDQWITVNLFDDEYKVGDPSVLSNNVDEYEASFTLKDGQVLTAFEVYAKDNTLQVTESVTSEDTLTPFDGCAYSGNLVAVDKTAPVVTVTKEVADGYKYVQSITEGEKTVDLYDGQVTYTISVKDQFLAEIGSNKAAYIYYSVNGVEQVPINLFDGGSGSVFSNNDDVYTRTITIQNADVLTALEVKVCDNAGNTTKDVISEDSLTPFTGCTYSGNLVAVDMTAPEITVTKAVEENHQYVQSITEGEKTVDLYDGKVTYTVNVKDQFLTSANSGEVYLRYKLEGSEEWNTVNLFDNAVGQPSIVSNNVDEYEASFTLEDGQVLTAFEVYAKDNTLHVTDSAISQDDLTPFTGCAYVGNLVAVDMSAPEITVTKTVEDGHKYVQSITEGEYTVDLYDGQVTYTVDVKDMFLVAGYGSVAEVEYKTEGSDQWIKLNLFDTKVGEPSIISHNEDAYTCSFTLTDGEVLTDLRINVEDNAANASNMDNLSVQDGDGKTSFAMKDYEVESEVTEQPEITEPETFDAETTEPETLDTEATEPETTEPEVVAPEMKAYLGYTGNLTAVDKTAPEVTVTKSVAADYSYIQTIDAGREKPVDFYNGKVTYTVDVTDQFLVTGYSSIAKVEYKLEGSDKWIPLNLFDNAVTQPSIVSHNEDAYTCSFTLGNGDVLTDIKVTVTDNAGNATASVNTADADETGLTTFDGCNYNGNPVCVDMTAPAVKVVKTVEKGSKYIQTYNHTGEGQDTDYYDGKVTYTFTVTDTNLTNAANQVQTLILTYKIDGQKLKSVVLPAGTAGWTKNEQAAKDQYTYAIELSDGDILTDMTITAIDNAGNTALGVTASDKDNTGLTVFEGCEYAGNDVLVDTTAPEVSIKVTGQYVEGYYTYNGVTYIKLSNKITGFDKNDQLAGQKDATVTLTVTAKDKNLTLAENDWRVVSNMIEEDGLDWTGAPKRNKTSAVTYVKTITVAENSTGILPFSLKVTDLAGNPVEDVKVQSINGTDSTIIEAEVEPNKAGVFGTNLSLDRRRPSSTNDTNAPKITIDPTIDFTTSNNDRDLFAGEFFYNVTITDGVKTGKKEPNPNSGIDKVQWVITDENGFVVAADVMNDEADGVYTKNYSIPVKISVPAGESNLVRLVITATDNVGNTTQMIKDFAVDTLAPRVTVSYDNNSVLNDKYFKADRVATITVEDINFNADTTPITTEVEDMGWSKNGDVYTTTRIYNVDGDYTFAMQSTDKANNQSEIDLTNGGVNAAPAEFTVDKTAPVISISFNPADAKDQDEKNVYHFDTDRTLTVSITEVNFKGEEVVAQMGEKNSLGRWTSNGNIHTAYTTFTPGNEYNVELNYTDLAGNPAKSVVSETFTVDDKAPTIEITTGEATLGELKIVQDDLVLGLTVNDAEGNLKGEPEVELIYIGTDFQQKKVDGVAYYTVSETVDRTTYAIDFTNIEKIKSNDGIYTLRVKTSDYAGHQVTLASDLVFSLNRFGSTFTAEDEFTKSFLNNEAGTVYHNKVEGDLVIKEINPNEVEQGSQGDGNGSLITVSANGVSKVLVNGADYEVKTEQKGNSTGHKWYEYTYTIYAGNFKDDNGELINGKYEILFYSEDAAGNKNTNEANEGSSIQVDKDGNPSGAINFVLDSHKPVVSVIGIEDGSQFNASNKTVQIDVSDNTPHTIEVYIDDVLVTREDDPQKLVNANDWLTYDEENSSYTLNLKEDNFGRDIRVVVIDAAGNPTEHEIKNVQVTENLFFLFINNTWLVVGSVLGLAAIIVVIIVLIRRKKEKKEA